jgi:hypothetical protein
LIFDRSRDAAVGGLPRYGRTEQQHAQHHTQNLYDAFSVAASRGLTSCFSHARPPLRFLELPEK